jgi:oxidase EvaA
VSATPGLATFREQLATSARVEEHDPVPLLEWLEEKRSKVSFSASLIGLQELRHWYRENGTANIVHESGAFFSIEGVRVTSRSVREVNSWEQPIYNQKEGGVLALLATRDGDVVRFLLNAKAEPGNIGTLQFAPTIQCTWSNLKRAHKGRLPPLGELIVEDSPGQLIYEALHNEEGGRFWRKSNSNRIILLDEVPAFDEDAFTWATLSQIKALALVDNVLSPFVKTIIAPL